MMSYQIDLLPYAQGKLTIAPKSIERIKQKILEITQVASMFSFQQGGCMVDFVKSVLH